MPYRGWELPEATRADLFNVFKPMFSEVVAHHVTLDLVVSRGVPPDAMCEIYGHACDVRGIEALMVLIDGQRKRPDGEYYHITWSLDRAAGFRPVHSKNLRDHKWVRGQYPAFHMQGKTFV